MFLIEKTGKTIEEALRFALIELEATEDEVNYEVIEEPAKGLLKIFSAKEAKIKVTLKEPAIRIAEEFLNDILDKMSIFAKVNSEIVGKNLNIKMEGKDMAVLIGRRGQTLDSLQYLISLVVNKDREDYLRVILDTENYRNKRKETLEKLAHKLAYKARKMRKDIVLEPMNPYERRIIHSTLQSNNSVSTRSQGEEPYRKVVIFLNKR
ncbi:RNA-binding cell elongation regulator Jag/EloR [Helicovermis profundi]|uniref:RNA-binding protein KhpB n=1 Tax=Helicovermis profundi TaxID=3065157 RepID=A0AAU9E6R9_9FIRM|nr:protein jag [Clostridia bacterium S502]